MIAVVSPTAYWTAVGIGAAGCAVACLLARRKPGPWRIVVGRLIGTALAADIVAYTVGLVVASRWTAETSLPLALCNAGVVVAAIACWWRVPLLVELTYFIGLAATLQAVLTPDLAVGFPHLVFFEYVVGHLGIVFAALFLVVGLRLRPRPGAVPRVFAVTACYTAFVGLIDAVTGANYMFLRRPPGEWTVLRLLGPWPWYVVSAAGVALVLLFLLDLPFRGGRAGPRRSSAPTG
ncbi:MAG: TIGR02206 family membrane protein [Acidimicrobiales bacterium]